MRIIGGAARGRLLKTPSGQDIRPTSDKVRLAIFNALFSRGGVLDKVIFDAFCGTGALGCEALSQGAAKVVFCDLSKISLNLAKENATALNFLDRSEFILKDATKIDHRPPTIKPIQIAFLDPPYRKGLISPTLDALYAGDWLSENALLILETDAKEDHITNHGQIVFDKTYGDTRVTFLQKK